MGTQRIAKFRNCARTMLRPGKLPDSLLHLEGEADITGLAGIVSGLRPRKC